MSKNKPYEQQMPEHQALNEAAMICEASSRNVEDFIASLPKDMMQDLIDVSIRDCKAGKGIPHDFIASYINEQMGWR